MSNAKFPNGPWVWRHPLTLEHEPSDSWHASLYAPNEQPWKRFVLEASSIGDGDAMPIRHLIAAAPDLYKALEILCASSRLRSLISDDEINPESPVGLAIAALAKARGEG